MDGEKGSFARIVAANCHLPPRLAMGLFDKLTGKATDPVCGMSIDKKGAADTATQSGQTYHFCSKGCAQKFRANPKNYA